MSRAPLPHTPPRPAATHPVRSDVLDSVRDIYGRVERRIADPDSHEDQLALSEAAEAERMWEEQMGRGRAAGGGGGSRLEAVVHNLSKRYEEKAAEKQRRAIQSMPAILPPRGQSHKRPGDAALGRQGKGPRRL